MLGASNEIQHCSERQGKFVKVYNVLLESCRVQNEQIIVRCDDCQL